VRMLTAALLGGFLLICGSSQATESERQEIIAAFAKVGPSVGALYAQEEGGDVKFLCSATAVAREGDKTVVLTAHHCLRKGVAYLINFGDNNFRSVYAWKVPHYEVNEREYPRRFNEPKTDMAFFLMDGTDIPVVSLRTGERLGAGRKVVMLGFPLGVTKIGYEGIVAGYFDRLGADVYGYIMLQIFGSPGSSGSSVVDVETGTVIGILVSGKQSFSGLPVIFATPIEYQKHLLPVRPDEEAEGPE
jgi:S1-C subfamily serine protease